MQQAQFPDRKEPANASPSFEHVQELKKKDPSMILNHVSAQGQTQETVS